jgi:cation transport ATPase
MTTDRLLFDGIDGLRTTAPPAAREAPVNWPREAATAVGLPPARPVAGEPGRGDADRTVLQRRVRVCAVLTVPVVALAWVPPLQVPYWHWVSLVLTALVVVWGALPLHRAALMGLRRHGVASLDALASLTVLTAFGASVHGLFATPAGAPDYRHAIPLAAVWSGGSGQLYLDVAATVTTVVLGARLLASGTRAQPGACGATDGSGPVDRIGVWVVPAVLLTAGAAAGFWGGGGAGRTAALAIALAVLVVACPVAVALAEPVAMLAAADAFRRRGIAVAGPHVFGSAGRVTAVLVTGLHTLATDDLPARRRSARAVARLRGLDLDPVLLTGEPAGVARASAEQVAVDAVVAELTPTERVAAVHRLRRAGAVVAVIGADSDDAPVLSAADLGIAITTEAGAFDAADVVVENADCVVEAVRLARCVAATVRTNRRWTAGVVAVAIPVAVAGLLHPAAALLVIAVCAGGAVVNSQGLRGPSPEWSASDSGSELAGAS